jgi:DnaJ-class molecular chaperone
VKDFYSVLGIDKQATESQIRQAYRRLASQHHPDKGGDTERFQEIQQAYDVLGDPQRRKEYDNPAPRMHSMPGFGFGDIFQMFGAQFRDPRSVSTARLQIWVSLADAITGGDRTIAVSSPAGQHNIEINIPKGIEDGASVRYPNLAPGGMDLVIQFRIRPEPGWERQNEHLIHDVAVSIWDLMLGGEIAVRTLGGRDLSVSLPANTQPGSLLRVRGHGVPHRSNTGAGDLFVRVGARLPTRISPQLQDLIRHERGH